jgi:predicted transposase YbfD/YdcC
MTIKLAADAPIFKVFGDLPDPRGSRNQLYPLIDILSVALIGVLCAGNDWVSIVRWAKYNEAWFRSVGLCLNGTPSHDTIGRFFRLVDPKAFEVCFRAWTQEIAAKIRGVIAVDGKTIRNSGDSFRGLKPQHIVSAFAVENDIILGQLRTEIKSNEITAIPELLDTFKLKGCTVTIDAMGCQKAIAAKIVERKGDYVLGLKGNQEQLRDETANFFEQALKTSPAESGCTYFSTIEKDHGRIETREVWASEDLEWLPMRQDWEALRSLACVKSTREEKGKTTIETRFYISSLPAVAENLGQVIRLHWAVENKLHWHLDITFNEDKSKIRSGNGAENFSLLKRCVLNLIKADTTKKDSINQKRKEAAYSEEYRLHLLGVK